MKRYTVAELRTQIVLNVSAGKFLETCAPPGHFDIPPTYQEALAEGRRILQERGVELPDLLK